MGCDKPPPAYAVPQSPLPTSMTPGGRLIRPVRCILFDIYGTLFISGSGDIGLAREKMPGSDRIKRLLRKYDIRISPRMLVSELLRTIEDKHRRLRDQGIDYPEIEIDRVWKQVLESSDLERVRRFAIEYEFIVNPVYPMPNLRKTLAFCKKQNLKMGLISNAQFFTPHLFEWFLNASLEDLGFHSGLIFLSYQIRHAKPSLVPFKMAADAVSAMGIDPAASLYVGNDMLNDIYPAKQLGIQTALFAGDQRSLRLRTEDPRCIKLSADLVLTDLGQLIAHLS